MPSTGMNMKHLLVATDFSDGSLNACRYALALFPTTDHHITLVHAYVEPVPGYTAMVQMTSTAYADSVEAMAGFVSRLRSEMSVSDPLPATKVVMGLLASVINDACNAQQVDLIVMGTQGAGGSMFGSHAATVAKSGRVPVLIVPQGARYKRVQRIILADDHQGISATDLHMVAELAQRHGAEVVIAHVLRDPDEQPNPLVIEQYDKAFAEVPHRYTSATGPTVDVALCGLAETEEADLLAVLHRHTGFFAGLFHGSIAKQLALHSHLPLLVLEHVGTTFSWTSNPFEGPVETTK